MAFHALFTRYNDVNKLLLDKRLSAEARNRNGWERVKKVQMHAGRTQEELDNPFILSSDPPRHTQLREFLNQSFTPTSIRAMAPRIEEITHELLDQVDGDCIDIIQALAYPLPVIVIAEML